MVSEAIARGNVQAVNYFVAQKYVDALRDVAMSPNQKLFLLPVEATSILGSLGGIAELAKETFGKDRPAAGQGAKP
jgi:regulator of protease activity HflC (stomatin/prohibitin superfamily)